MSVTAVRPKVCYKSGVTQGNGVYTTAFLDKITVTPLLFEGSLQNEAYKAYNCDRKSEMHLA